MKYILKISCMGGKVFEPKVLIGSDGVSLIRETICQELGRYVDIPIEIICSRGEVLNSYSVPVEIHEDLAVKSEKFTYSPEFEVLVKTGSLNPAIMTSIVVSIKNGEISSIHLESRVDIESVMSCLDEDSESFFDTSNIEHMSNMPEQSWWMCGKKRVVFLSEDGTMIYLGKDKESEKNETLKKTEASTKKRRSSKKK